MQNINTTAGEVMKMAIQQQSAQQMYTVSQKAHLANLMALYKSVYCCYDYSVL